MSAYYFRTDGTGVDEYTVAIGGIQLTDGPFIPDSQVDDRRLFATRPSENPLMRLGADGVWVYSITGVPWDQLPADSRIVRMDTLRPPRLNDARVIDYVFTVVEFDEWVWLYDDSERTYPCCATPHVCIEALYWNGDEDEHPDYTPDPGMLTEAQLRDLPRERVPGDYPWNLPRKEAWDAAREEANGNCLL